MDENAQEPKADPVTMMQAFGQELETRFPGSAHVLLVIEPQKGEASGGVAHYTSNTSPNDVRGFLRELLERFDEPHAENAKDVTGE